MKLNWKLQDCVHSLLVVLVLYYGCPLFIRDTGLAMVLLLAVIPAGIFATGFVGGQKHGLMPFFPLFTFGAMIPQYWILMHQWDAVLYYAVMYTVSGTAGMTAGWALERFGRKKGEPERKTGTKRSKRQEEGHK